MATWDDEVGAGYLYLLDPIDQRRVVATTVEIPGGLLVDLDEDGVPLGVEWFVAAPS